MRFYPPKKNCMRTFLSSIHIVAPSAERLLRPTPTGRNIAPLAANGFTESRNRERAQTEKWTVRHRKSLKNQGLQPPIWDNAYKILRSLKIGGQTVHKQKRKDVVMKRKLVTVDAETLLSTPMSKTMFTVDGLIPQGVNVLSGVAKIGKSWLMLWLGLQVSQGLPVWGIPTMHCDVLYLCLEDTLKRIKDRLFDLTDDSTGNFHLAVTCGLIGNGWRRKSSLLGGLPEDKAGDHRHAPKGAGFQGERRESGNVRQRLRRHFFHQADC